jgi:hypothetical protein
VGEGAGSWRRGGEGRRVKKRTLWLIQEEEEEENIREKEENIRGVSRGRGEEKLHASCPALLYLLIPQTQQNRRLGLEGPPPPPSPPPPPPATILATIHNALRQAR